MSVSYIPENVKTRLWGKAAGRCQYQGCNESLYYDSLTHAEFNASYIAHIYADSKLGPRYDPVYSPKLKKDISNLMLLCDKHHRLIDKQEVLEHPPERLIKMKSDHELRIAMLSSIVPDKQSHIVLFGANIGQQQVPLNYNEARNAMLPHRYPSQLNAIELGLKNSRSQDHNNSYWLLQDEQIKEAFQRNIETLKGRHNVQHFSVFGLAPIPLLIRLGALFSDIYEIDVFQRHREPCTWAWQSDSDECTFSLTRPDNYDGLPVLNISLSGHVECNRIENVLNSNCSIWTLSINNPNNDFLKTKVILSEFRKIVRRTLNMIKLNHGQNTLLHVFPAMPVSAAIEFGRVWMPKADLPMMIYDQSNIHKKFIPTINFN